MEAEIQLPFDFDESFLPVTESMMSRAIAPEAKRIVENPAASIVPPSSAIRQRTELPAKATSAMDVSRITRGRGGGANREVAITFDALNYLGLRQPPPAG